MKLDENYRLESDSNQWTLIYEKEGAINPKTDKPIVSSDKWYFGNLKQALMRYTDQSVKPSETVEELLIQLIRVEGAVNSSMTNPNNSVETYGSLRMGELTESDYLEHQRQEGKIK